MSKTEKELKLSQSIMLRIMNKLGMITWDDLYVDKLRLLHPLSWPCVFFILLCSLVIRLFEWVIEVVETFKRDTVWW